MTARAAARKRTLSHASDAFHAKVEPVPATSQMAGTGGGRIVFGRVFEDRNQVRSATVFAVKPDRKTIRGIVFPANA